MNDVLRSARAHLAARAPLYLLILIIAGSIALTAGCPVYFRTDDVHYLSWASSHNDPLDAFRSPEGELFGVVRPVHTLAWWCLYRIFGLNAAGYQFFLTLSYGLSFLFLFLFVRRTVSNLAATLTLLLYAVMFSSLMHIVFWFSDLTFATELLFANLSLYLLARGVRETWPFVPLGLFAYLLAGLSKEPAVLIVPAVVATYVWVAARDRSARAGALLFLAAGLAWVLLSPYLRGRQGLPLDSGTDAAVDFVRERWRYYGRVLMSGPSAAALASALFLASRDRLRRRAPGNRLQPGGARGSAFMLLNSVLFPVAIASIGLFVLRGRGGPGLTVLAFALAAVILRGSKESPAATLALVPLLAIMTAEPYFSVYLTEASIGLAVVAGIAAWRFLRDSRRLLVGFPTFVMRASLGLLAVVVVAGAVAATPRFRVAAATASAVSETRQDFRDVMTYVAENLGGRPAHLIVVDYRDLGVESVHELRGLSPVAMARRQKTMSGHEIQILLRLLGVTKVEVHGMGWYLARTDASPAYAVALSRYESDYLGSLPLEVELLYSTSPRRDGAALYRLAGR